MDRYDEQLFAFISDNAKPFLKWAGGKQQLIADIESRLPLDYKYSRIIPKYIEPFIGGGAVFFYLKSHYQIEQAIILDINPDLICSYKVVQNDVEELICILREMESAYNSATSQAQSIMFYEVRDSFNNDRLNLDFNTYDSRWIDRASKMIFLNKTCFNGLYRQNSKGHFNVPQGSYKKPTICQQENLRNANKALRNTQILLGEFDVIHRFVDRDTFIYYDPPYRPLNSTSSFNSYSKDGFNDNDQRRLASLFVELNKIPLYQMLSNSDPLNANPNDTFFDELYNGFKINRINAKRMINSNASKRGLISELLITNY